MNNLEIVEGGHYKAEFCSDYTKDIYVIKKVKISGLFGAIDGIIYKEHEDGYEHTMTEKEFHRIALYQVK